ncbi:uncharacterized protein DUF4412 [Roseivirga ehrenbergii]|uniref:DUF4412 domain-containing protein n=1 Tax=Roseivirga ehrenbergii (strain DSM 102268 / JCM 13514 / KCTC 12282 / NCIMB 14502 / KMM 6017) TaxID=279360 RepID=A0A150WXS0_ROSEK|nr:DUF4412 domain-containing protein [Roseivirga ehrenbergii]KYG71277.1 hypothetical protein MB14_10885 [Roseivirga ehrenbergii]TCK99683.1 uncharacterized protein DUF4412 [Roseivirga ehrenbergii]
MKKMAILLMVSILLTASSPFKDFQGVITYGIKYSQLPKEMKGMESMLPSEMMFSIKDSKIKIEQSLMGGSQVVISNQKEKTAEILMDMMGQKIHIHMSKEEIEAEEANTKNPEVTYLNETKKLAGFTCKKVLVKTEDGSESVMWITDKISVKHKDFQYLNGFPLEYETEQEGMIMHISALKVEEKKLGDEHFGVPEGYTAMTMEELTRLGGN